MTATIPKSYFNANANGTYEYLLVANPDPRVKDKVMEEKQFFYDRFNEAIAIKTKPHITIANFKATEAMEDRLSNYIQRVCSQIHSFPVALNNFSSFPAHTIYLRVQNHQPFRKLATALKSVNEYIGSCGMSPAHFVNNPHMSIARSLPPEIYEKAAIEFSRRDFHEDFICNELILLRKQAPAFKTIMKFRFLPENPDSSSGSFQQINMF